MTRKILTASIVSASMLAFAAAASAGGASSSDMSRSGQTYGAAESGTTYYGGTHTGATYGATARSGSQYDQAALYDTPFRTPNMTEGTMGQASIVHMDIQSGPVGAQTAESPGPDAMPTMNAHLSGTTAPGVSHQAHSESVEEQLDNAAYTVQFSTSTASEGLTHEQLAVRQAELFGLPAEYQGSYSNDAALR